MKKLLSLLIVLALAVGAMSFADINVYADGSHSIKVTNGKADKSSAMPGETVNIGARRSKSSVLAE